VRAIDLLPGVNFQNWEVKHRRVLVEGQRSGRRLTEQFQIMSLEEFCQNNLRCLRY
jgi:predicted DNA-binding ribbon-helix-helix protein